MYYDCINLHVTYFDLIPSSKSKQAHLAWASAQIHCQCSVSEARVTLPKSTKLTPTEMAAVAGNNTSFVPSRGQHSSQVSGNQTNYSLPALFSVCK